MLEEGLPCGEEEFVTHDPSKKKRLGRWVENPKRGGGVFRGGGVENPPQKKGRGRLFDVLAWLEKMKKGTAKKQTNT